jgi:hypothetical protein
MKETMIAVSLMILTGLSQLSLAEEVERIDASPPPVWLDECPVDVCEVSAYRLVALPEKFEQQKILLTGVLKREFDQWALYVNSDSAYLGIYADSFDLVVLKKRSAHVLVVSAPKIDRDTREAAMSGSKTYVSVVGTFSRKNYGVPGIRSGSLDVTSVDPVVLIERR